MRTRSAQDVAELLDGMGVDPIGAGYTRAVVPAPALPTLVEDLPSLDVKALRLQCGNYHRCWHRGTLPVEAIYLRQTIDDVQRRLVCTACGFIGGSRLGRTLGWAESGLSGRTAE